MVTFEIVFYKIYGSVQNDNVISSNLYGYVRNNCVMFKMINITINYNIKIYDNIY